MIFKSKLLWIILLAGMSGTAFANDSFRCGAKIVEMNMSRAEVLERCGPPTVETGDQWVYDRGPDQFTIIVHFAPNDTVSRIEEQPGK
jgi:hypothetical protein